MVVLGYNCCDGVVVVVEWLWWECGCSGGVIVVAMWL